MKAADVGAGLLVVGILLMVVGILASTLAATLVLGLGGIAAGVAGAWLTRPTR